MYLTFNALAAHNVEHAFQQQTAALVQKAVTNLMQTELHHNALARVATPRLPSHHYSPTVPFACWMGSGPS